MGNTTKIIYGGALAVAIVLMFLIFSMSNSKQLKVDVQNSEQLLQQKVKEIEALQQQLKTTMATAESAKIDNGVILELKTAIDSGEKEKQAYMQQIGELQASLQTHRESEENHIAELTTLQKQLTEREKAKKAADTQLGQITEKLSSVQEVLGQRDEEISQLVASVEQKTRAIKFHKENFGETTEEITLLKSNAATELLNQTLILDELVVKSQIIEELNSRLKKLGGSTVLPEELASALNEESPTSDKEIAALVGQLNDDNSTVTLQNEIAAYAEELSNKEDELLAAREEFNQYKTTHQDNLFDAITKIEALHSTKETLDITINEQDTLIQKMTADVQKKDTLISSGQEEIVQLQADNQGLKDKVKELSLSEAASQEEVIQLQANLTDKQNEITAVKEKSNAMAAPLFDARTKIEDLNSTNESFTITLKDKDTLIQTLNDQIQKKDALISSDQAEMEKLQAANQKLQEEHKKQLLTEADNQKELSQLKTDLTAKQTEIETVKEQSNALALPLTEKIENLEQQLTEASTKSTALEAELSTTTASIDSLKKDKETLSVELSTAKAALEEARQQTTEMNNALEETKASLLQEENTRQALTTDMEPVKLALAQSEEKNDDLNSQYRNLEKQLADLQASREQANAQKPDDANKVAEQEAKIAGLVEELATAKSTSDKQMATLQTTEEQIAQINSEKEALSAKLQNVQQTNKELIEQSEKANKQIVSLEEKAATLAATLDENKSNLTSSHEEIATLKSTVSSIQEEQETLRLNTVDTDNDGVVDSVDECADTLQGVTVNTQGCEEDSDKDGIVNRLDLCPDTASGLDIDNAGCSAEQTTIVLKGINFQIGTSKLTQNATSILNMTAVILKNNPEIKMEVAGHTDSIGNANLNQQLSTTRAKAVLNFLVAAGVAEDRLQAKGYGSDDPIADNASSEGRAKNRRVELRKL